MAREQLSASDTRAGDYWPRIHKLIEEEDSISFEVLKQVLNPINFRTFLDLESRRALKQARSTWWFNCEEILAFCGTLWCKYSRLIKKTTMQDYTSAHLIQEHYGGNAKYEFFLSYCSIKDRAPELGRSPYKEILKDQELDTIFGSATQGKYNFENIEKNRKGILCFAQFYSLYLHVIELEIVRDIIKKTFPRDESKIGGLCPAEQQLIEQKYFEYSAALTFTRARGRFRKDPWSIRKTRVYSMHPLWMHYLDLVVGMMVADAIDDLFDRIDYKSGTRIVRCADCGKRFQVVSSGRQPKYCSKQCRQNAAKRRYRDRRTQAYLRSKHTL